MLKDKSCDIILFMIEQNSLFPDESTSKTMVPDISDSVVKGLPVTPSDPNPYREQDRRANDIVERRGEDLKLDQTGVPSIDNIPDGTPEVRSAAKTRHPAAVTPRSRMPGSNVFELPKRGRSNTSGLPTPKQAKAGEDELGIIVQNEINKSGVQAARAVLRQILDKPTRDHK